MTEKDIMGALFIQQRIQIMHIGKHHDEFDDAYLYAWESGVYPLMSDTDGSVPRKPHEPYAEFFTSSKAKVEFLLKRLDDAWRKKEGLTFYGLEDELGVRSYSSKGWDRSDLIHICRYLYLDGCYDKEFWDTLVENGKCPAEALSLNSEYDREIEIYF
ncbi:TPA: hypothetical protein K8N54_004046 [Serratia marcescens]|jgi:antitoxin MazE|uniref:hypothetical protein n=1 Tax=Serratia marcescens TaxID=615 RepID=UPI0013DAA028|nr:hypothetical protein [Serratia marcescens]BCZ43662.1 hypothetical protein SMGES_49880 [Serratia marcescens]HBI6268852.1 hypothetical protein [Serratia marcescens]HBI6949476.1 hypothetical protein [Serratia marcescens]HBI6959718.1 hypothetical protein [Serratia marcescens]